MVILHAVQSVFSIVIMISLGYILCSRKFFSIETSKLFSKLVVNISLPAYMISNLLTTYHKDTLLNSATGLTIPFLSMFICYIISIVISFIIKVEPSRRGVFQSMFFVSNTIFIGLPVNLSLFGEKSVPFVLLYYIANTVFFWTVGVYGIAKDGKKGTDSSNIGFNTKSLCQIFSPPLTSFLAAVVLVLLNVKLPEFLMDTFKYIGNLTTPLSMFFIGITIYSIDFKKIKFNKEVLWILIGRFLISPLAVIALAFLIPIPELMKKVFVIQAAMPIMTQTAIIAKSYDADYEFAAVMAAVTTAASLIFIPVYMYILSRI